MHAQQLIKQNIKNVSPIYLLFGEEPYFIQKVKERIIESVKNNKDPGPDTQTYDMETIAVQEAIHDVETFPFFSEHKIVIINRASFLTGQTKSDIEHDIKALEEYIAQPTDFSTLIIVAPYEKLDQRKKIVKTIKEHSELVDCSPPHVNDMQDMIKSMAKQHNLSLPNEVTELMTERIGDHLDALQKELTKLSLYFGEQEVTVNEAEQLISTYAETSSFSLIDALVQNQLGQALIILKELKKQNEEPIALLALVTSQVRLILQCKLLKKKGYQQQQMAKQIKAHPYAVKMASKRERFFSEAALKQIIIEGTNTDEKLKTGQMDKWLALEMYLKVISTQLNTATAR
ncbi:DNA polymerase III subunit delta [Alkalibacillus haloalkaliphilus]|uniref:DNA polymerase III subunit delta n=1 Tax=Alkalibacillus haloalkaliphilus TaxID=94136 RepID=UPI00293538DC|nr:DNA polymerase III subunit delta [Alkalibacillus haloalkaliphilus]MDV2581046.1 DNA polymerase III subunit delta [Alkalibacillus haloalkaliphilus]